MSTTRTDPGPDNPATVPTPDKERRLETARKTTSLAETEAGVKRSPQIGGATPGSEGGGLESSLYTTFRALTIKMLKKIKVNNTSNTKTYY